MIEFLIANVTATISMVEIIWSTISMMGLILHIAAMTDVHRDIVALKREKANGVLMLTARAWRMEERNRFGVKVLLFAVGVMAMLRPPPPDPRGTLPLTLLLVAAVAWLTGTSIRKAIYRKHIREYGARVIQDDEALNLRQLLANGMMLTQLVEQGVITVETLKRIHQEQKGVASDLKDAQQRADEVPPSDPPGAASDAAFRSKDGE